MKFAYILACTVAFAAVMAAVSAGARFLVYGISDDFSFGLLTGIFIGAGVMGYAAWRDHREMRSRIG